MFKTENLWVYRYPQEWIPDPIGRTSRCMKMDGQAEEMRASLALLHDQVKELTFAQEEN